MELLPVNCFFFFFHPVCLCVWTSHNECGHGTSPTVIVDIANFNLFKASGTTAGGDIITRLLRGHGNHFGPFRTLLWHVCNGHGSIKRTQSSAKTSQEMRWRAGEVRNGFHTVTSQSLRENWRCQDDQRHFETCPDGLRHQLSSHVYLVNREYKETYCFAFFDTSFVKRTEASAV